MESERIVNCWGWINSDETIQSETFKSSNLAIYEMKQRLGIRPDDDHCLSKIYKHGFKLVCLEKRFKVTMVLE